MIYEIYSWGLTSTATSYSWLETGQSRGKYIMSYQSHSKTDHQNDKSITMARTMINSCWEQSYKDSVWKRNCWKQPDATKKTISVGQLPFSALGTLSCELSELFQW